MQYILHYRIRKGSESYHKSFLVDILPFSEIPKSMEWKSLAKKRGKFTKGVRTEMENAVSLLSRLFPSLQ